jgi:hypothetical protein
MTAARPFTEPSIKNGSEMGPDDAVCGTAARREKPASPAPAQHIDARTTRVLVMHEDPLLALGAFSTLMRVPNVLAFLYESALLVHRFMLQPFSRDDHPAVDCRPRTTANHGRPVVR